MYDTIKIQYEQDVISDHDHVLISFSVLFIAKQSHQTVIYNNENNLLYSNQIIFDIQARQSSL